MIYVMGRRTKKQKIIDISIQLFFNSTNINKISIEDIAREANVSPATIYNNFKNRDSLISEVVKEIGFRNLEIYRKIVQSNKPFPQKIQLIINEKIKSFSDLDFDSIYKITYGNEELMKFMEDLSANEIAPLLIKFINEGKRQGYIESGLSPESIILYIEMISEGSKALYFGKKDRIKDGKVLNDLNDICFYGFAKKKKDKI